MKIEATRYYSVSEIADMFEVTRQAVLSRIKRKQLHATKRFSQWYVLGEEINNKLIQRNY